VCDPKKKPPVPGKESTAFFFAYFKTAQISSSVPFFIWASPSAPRNDTTPRKVCKGEKHKITGRFSQS
jgi:hypothetical protein